MFVNDNWIVLPCLDNLHLTRKAIDSCLRQTVPTTLFIINDGSQDNTVEYLHGLKHVVIHNPTARGVTWAWNTALDFIFRSEGADHALVINNDIILHPEFYARLLSQPEPLISGVSVSRQDELVAPASYTKSPHPDFSAYLIRREVWNKVGQFDPRFINYCSDGDMHIRIAQVGLLAMGMNLPFYHERSSTLKNASPEDNKRFCEIADGDRARFQAKYGFPMWGEEYDKACSQRGE